MNLFYVYFIFVHATVQYYILSNFFSGVNKSADEVLNNVINIVRKNIGPVAAFKLAVLVPKLPKTRAGKIARNTVALMAAGQPFKVSNTQQGLVFGVTNIKQLIFYAFYALKLG